MKKNNMLVSLLKLVTVTTAGIYGFNKFISYCAGKNNSLKDNSGEVYLWKHGKLFYTVQGEGEPLLLIHDLSHFGSGKEWQSVIEALSQNRKVYTLDLLGCGRSDKPAITYTNYLFVQMITDFVKDVIKQKTDIIISGEACPIAITTSANNSDILGKILMVNPPSVSNTDIIPNTNTRITKRIIELPIIGTFAFNVLNSKSNCFEKSIEEYFTKDDYTSYTYSQTMYDASHKGRVGSKYILASIIGLYTNLSIRRPLTSIENEVYIIGGSFEPNIEEIISSYRAIKSNVNSTIIEGAKHFPHLETPEDFINSIEKYL